MNELSWIGSFRHLKRIRRLVTANAALLAGLPMSAL